MHNPMKTVVVASLMLVLVVASPVVTAQNQRTTPNAGNAVTSPAEGKILWQYNTHG
ncbi:MAG: hypothetical protein WAV20_22145 [Blastocatellia bacterium]